MANKLVVYLSQWIDIDKERDYLSDADFTIREKRRVTASTRAELFLGKNVYATGPGPLFFSDITKDIEGLVKNLAETACSLPSGIEFVIENDQKFQCIDELTFRRIKEAYAEKGRAAVK